MKASPNSSDKRLLFEQRIAEWIKDKDLFWLSELKQFLGVESGDIKGEAMVSQICIALKKDGLLMPCERRSGRIQYMTINKK